MCGKLIGPECLAAIRRIAPDIAGWNDKYLVGLFVNAVGKF